MWSNDISDGVTEFDDMHKLALIIDAKESLRAEQRAQTWDARVKAIARMNVASRQANASMASAVQMPRQP